jgi:hypothetical protein
VDRFGRPQRGVQYSPYKEDKPSFKVIEINEAIKTQQVWIVAEGGLLELKTPYSIEQYILAARFRVCRTL